MDVAIEYGTMMMGLDRLHAGTTVAAAAMNASRSIQTETGFLRRIMCIPRGREIGNNGRSGKSMGKLPPLGCCRRDADCYAPPTTPYLAQTGKRLIRTSLSRRCRKYRGTSSVVKLEFKFRGINSHMHSPEIGSCSRG